MKKLLLLVLALCAAAYAQQGNLDKPPKGTNPGHHYGRGHLTGAPGACVRVAADGRRIESLDSCSVADNGDITLRSDVRVDSSPENTSYGGAPWVAADAWYMDISGVRVNGLSFGYNIGVDGALDTSKPALYCSSELDYFDGVNHWMESYCETQTGPGDSVIRRPVGWGAKMNDPSYLDFLSSFSGTGCWTIYKDLDPYSNPGNPPRTVVMKVCGDSGAVTFNRPILATSGTSQFDVLEANSLRLHPTSVTCTASTRGQFNFAAGAAGAPDAVQVCAKAADGSYSWRTVF